VDRVTVDVPEDYLGVVTQLLALRRGRMAQITNHGTGWVRLEHLVPARGLVGFRTELLTETRGTGLLHHVFERMEPWAGDIRPRRNGSLVADRSGLTTAYSLINLQDRGQLFVGPGVEVYEGMVIGHNSRPGDMDVNPTREKKQTNMRAAAADQTEKLVPARPLSLELALGMLREDECLEVTPQSLRARKVLLEATKRARARG
jgi:GTP-binding protein